MFRPQRRTAAAAAGVHACAAHCRVAPGRAAAANATTRTNTCSHNITDYHITFIYYYTGAVIYLGEIDMAIY